MYSVVLGALERPTFSVFIVCRVMDDYMNDLCVANKNKT